MSKYYLNYLDELESEAIFILREVWAQFENPVILFSGGKDSTALVTYLLVLLKEGRLAAPTSLTILMSDTRQELLLM